MKTREGPLKKNFESNAACSTLRVSTSHTFVSVATARRHDVDTVAMAVMT